MPAPVRYMVELKLQTAGWQGDGLFLFWSAMKVIYYEKKVRSSLK